MFPDLVMYLVRRCLAVVPVCPFHEITGVPCPTCGSTRAVLSLLEGRVVDAIAWNPLVMLGTPLFFLYLCVGLLLYARTGRFPEPRWQGRNLLVARIVSIGLVGANWIYLVAIGA